MSEDRGDKAEDPAQATEAPAQATEAPAQATGVQESKNAPEALDEDAVGYEQGSVLVALDEGLTVDQAREVIANETDLQDVSIEGLTESFAKVTFSGNTSVEDAVKDIST